MSFKNKIFDKILSKSNSYSFYKNYYNKMQKPKKNVVQWEDIFKMLANHEEMFNVTMNGVRENFSKGYTKMKICPLCGYRMPTFIAGGVKYRKNAMCPHCNSLERHRLLWFFIKNKLNIEDNIRLLHFAPEKSFYDIFENLRNIDYYTGDIEESPYVKEIIDIQNIGYEDNFFDYIICNHVLEHVPDDRKAMEELYRIVKPKSENAGVIIMVPLDFNSSETLEKEEYNTPELREKYYGQHDHVRMYGMDFQYKLEDVGFAVESFDCNSSFIKDHIKYGFNEIDMIFYCTKE